MEHSAYKTFGPGEYIKEELQARKWNLEKFSKMTGIPREKLKIMLKDLTPMTKRIAEKIGKGFGTSTALWTNLSREYRNKPNR